MSDNPRTYPDELEIQPLSKPPVATIHVPGSKSITNRALVLAALQGRGHGRCELSGALRSEDTEVMVDSLKALNFDIETDWATSRIHVCSQDRDRIIPAESAELFVANSGTTMRFLTAMVSLGQGRYRLDGVPRMRERPIGDLLSALCQLGVNAYSENGDGCPPVIVEARGLRGGETDVKGDISSQFLSGLLMAAPFAESDVVISLVGSLVSIPYVVMTMKMMGEFGFEVRFDNSRCFCVPGRQLSGIDRYEIEPDASAASYFFAAAAITKGSVCVPTGKTSIYDGGRSRIEPSEGLLQGDWRFVDLLEKMNCKIERDANWKFVHALRGGSLPSAYLSYVGIRTHGASLRGIDVDMNAISDTVMTLAAVACFADGPTTIRNVAHIRHKETDRLTALATELRKVGAEVEEFPDGLRITPRPLHGAVIETYNDHRMAMSMALIGLRVPGIVIRNPGCVAKTYPGFFDDLEKLRC